MFDRLRPFALREDDPPKYRVVHPLGSMAPFRDDPLQFVMDVHESCGDVVRFRLAHINAYIVRHPDDVHHVLVKNNAGYGKQTIGYKKLALFLGQGLVTSEGDFWRRQRRIAQPAFHRKRIAGFARVMNEMADDTVRSWAPAIANGDPIEMSGEMMRLTLRIVANTLLSIDVEQREADVADAITELLEMFNVALGQVIPIHEKLPTPTHKRWKAAMGLLDALVYRVIAQRREAARRGDGTREELPDLLDMLMHATDEESGESMNDLQLRDEVMTMFVAGHETTANALAWAFYELAVNPAVVAKMHRELDEVLDGRTPGLADLPRLTYTQQVVEETMRLHPPVWLLARSVHGDDTLGGYRINDGSFVFISPYAVHRHPEFWPDPDRFDPDRFSPEAKEHRPRYAYLPFSGGPRVCIGNAFAEMEAKLILARAVAEHRFSLVPGQTIVADPSVTLRPKYGVKVHVSRR